MTPDQPTRAIAEFAASDLSVDAVSGERYVRHFVDAIGCAVGGYYAAPSRIARELAASTPTPRGCSVLGLPDLVAPEQAVFAAVCLVRQLDFNDSLRGGGHPSDMMSAVLAAGELADASGEQVLAGFAVGYEVFAALASTYPLRAAGWDQGPFIAVSVAAAVGHVWGLDVERLANAVSLALTPALALHVVRTGELSNWKGCATASGAMAGFLAARLARAGLTGPDEPFCGVDGFHRQVLPRHELQVPARPDEPAVLRCSIKRYPAVIHSQGVAETLIDLRPEIDVAAVESVNVDTYHDAWWAVGGGGGDHDEKWHPRTRETADHSLPYAVALALQGGDIRLADFGPARLGDPGLRALMARVSVAERADLTALFPDERRSVITLTFRTGETREVTTTFATGTPQRPMSDEQIAAKFHGLADPVLGGAAAADLLAVLSGLAKTDRITDLTGALRAASPATAGPGRAGTTP